MPDPFDFADEDILPQSDRLHILSPEEYELLKYGTTWCTYPDAIWVG
jgi:hypothetical protein